MTPAIESASTPSVRGTVCTINVAMDFSRYPLGRTAEDGDHSGLRFRTEHLLPAFKANERVVVELDGTRSGYGSSFLDAAFGDLVRKDGFTEAELRHRLVIETTDVFDLKLLWLQIERAEEERRG